MKAFVVVIPRKMATLNFNHDLYHYMQFATTTSLAYHCSPH